MQCTATYSVTALYVLKLLLSYKGILQLHTHLADLPQMTIFIYGIARGVNAMQVVLT